MRLVFFRMSCYVVSHFFITLFVFYRCLFDVILIDVMMLYAFSLVVSELSTSWTNCSRSRRYLEGLSREMVKPNGVNVSNLIIQKSSLLSSVLVVRPLNMFFFFWSFAMMVTLACLKSCPADLKCFSTSMELSHFVCVLWVFILRLNIVSHFPTYDLKWHKMHSMRYMT